jgi:prevent-host-death family protein
VLHQAIHSNQVSWGSVRASTSAPSRTSMKHAGPVRWQRWEDSVTLVGQPYRTEVVDGSARLNLYMIYNTYMSSEYLISVTDARGQLADLVNRVSYTGEHVTLTRHGRPMAVLVPVADAERLRSDPASPTGDVSSLPSTTQLGHTPSVPYPNYRIAARALAPPPSRGHPGRT